MSKPMLVTLPFVMLLLDWWPLERVKSGEWQVAEFRRLVRGKNSVLSALSAISCVVTFFAQQKGGAVTALTRISLSQRLDNAFVSYARYLGKTFWPDPLANAVSASGTLGRWCW